MRRNSDTLLGVQGSKESAPLKSARQRAVNPATETGVGVLPSPGSLCASVLVRYHVPALR